MSVSHLTESTVRRCASVEVFERGYAYYQGGAVLSLIRRGEVIEAAVQGSEAQAYRVRCAFDADDAVAVMCTCPYSEGGWCKHVVAVCLCVLHRPEQVEERPTLDALLSNLDQEQLQSLVLKLAERDSTVIEVIEEFAGPTAISLTGKRGATAKVSTRRIGESDVLVVRQNVRSIVHSLDRMRSSEAYWHIEEAVERIRKLLQVQVWTLIEADNGRDALPLLEAMTKEYLANWEYLDDSDGEASAFFSDLGMAWTEALLSVDLSQKERKTWRKRLDGWQQEVDVYGVDAVFEAAQCAALQGWDYPPLQRVLQGHITEQGAWEGEPSPYADDLACARLHVLERRERWQEYLYLAEAEGQDEAYVTMLVRLDRIQEATEYGLKHLALASEALSLAKALYERGEREKGLQVAEHGLTLQGSKLGLAKWARDEAAAMGNLPRALVAAKVAFREDLSLASYQRAENLAGDQWPAVRDELLDVARHASRGSAGQIDVLLHEGCVDDAIKVVDAGAYYTEIAKVVDAAVMSHPDWAIQTSRKQAENIMNRGQAELYTAASKWLARARTAYLNMDRAEEWQAYMADLLTQHRRKYKLVPMLKALQ